MEDGLGLFHVANYLQLRVSGRIARPPLNGSVHTELCHFKYTQNENCCKNTKPTFKLRWAHSSVAWQNQPLKSPLNWVEI